MSGIDERQEAMLDQAQYCESMYALAARAFSREMDATTLAAIVGAADAEHAAADDGEEQPLPDLLVPESTLLDALGRLAGNDLEEVVRRSRTEFAELFLGPRPPLAPYYESMYLGFPNRMFSEQTRSVRRAYERHGFTVAERERNKVPDDQLGFELEFVSNLCRAALDAEGDPDRVAELHAARMEFLEQHLAAWLPAFCERLEAAPCADFYPTWARFARDLAAADFSAGRQAD